MLPQHDHITQLATAALAAHGLSLVAVHIFAGQSMTVQVLAEQPSGASPTVTQCMRASRTLSAQLDVAEVINRRYTLEVSSPGLDRPLLTPTHYQRYLGRGVKVSFTMPQANAHGKQVGGLTGVLTAATNETITVDGLTFPMQVIKSAHLATTADELAQLMKGHFLPGDVSPTAAEDGAEDDGQPQVSPTH